MGWFSEHGWQTYIGRRPDGWQPGNYTITRKDVGRIDPKLLVDLPGGNGEHRYFRHNDGQFESAKYPGQEWLDMVNWAKEELAKPDTTQVVMIVKDKDHRVYIHEGNHRIRAAVQAGLPDIPVEFVYWAFSEDSGLIYNPETTQFSTHGLAPAPLRSASISSTSSCVDTIRQSSSFVSGMPPNSIMSPTSFTSLRTMVSYLSSCLMMLGLSIGIKRWGPISRGLPRI